MIIERLAQAGDIAMAENAEAAAAQAHSSPSISMNWLARYRTMACAVVSRTVPSFMSAVTSRRQRQILRIFSGSQNAACETPIPRILILQPVAN
jgi:hypothetical protein